MDKPQIAAAPGLAWRPRRNGWAAVWLARQDIAKNKGFKPTTHQIGIFSSELTEADLILIRRECTRLQDEMYAFIEKQPKVFAGTVRALISAYQTDKDSPYPGMRYRSRLQLDTLLRRIDAKFGAAKLNELGARDFKRWYEAFRWPDGKDGRELITTAHAIMTTVRMVFSFGSTFEIEKASRDRISECSRLRVILHDMKFENKKSRTESLTWRQCEDIIAAANAAGLPSIALTQAMQFDLRTRQKDIIGEWVPVSEPGISVIGHYHARKWLRGIRWEEISSAMKLAHPISKSRTGKVLERDLTLYPMIMAELDKIPAEKRTGPVIVCELTGRPWVANHFRMKWREIATACGVPATVFNMDSRAGGITETIEATGGNLEAARKEAEHSDIKTTMGYSRRKQEANKESAAKVLDFRSKNTA
jgi:hypothetical protein